MRGRALVVLGCALLMAGCATTVGGTASPASPPSEAKDIAAGEPCELLTPEQAAALYYEEKGQFTPGKPGQLVPAACSFTPAYSDQSMDLLDIYFSVDIPLGDYVAGVEPEWEKEIGGLTWARYPDPFGGESMCTIATELSPSSFVAIMSSNFSDESKSCEQAEAAAPFVSSHLPGGAPATVEPRKPSPLESVNPCSLLTPEHAEKLGRRGHGEYLEPGDLLPARCNWINADGDDRNTTIVGVETKRPAPDPETRAEGEPKKVEADGREWVVYGASIPGMCVADLAVTDRSYVSITVTDGVAETDEVCAKVEDAIPLVTKNLPKE
ncbi:DUF3558 family protein [Saccharomonospora xinjiangensis]|uniref:DUF3558 domain-containing protein n=1 Tax=Saccharomonospora xinjiangensis XJ-54 TaxID=882086 RepID=I0V205_9PSEU|nr:DUF3558 family protein [Saccharomonospora xinjiangensis]EID54158.1 hypothetical protein SacxiDRAFT_1921 [Saccharomonospora xinjiangensis XJ-54]